MSLTHRPVAPVRQHGYRRPVDVFHRACSLDRITFDQRGLTKQLLEPVELIKRRSGEFVCTWWVVHVSSQTVPETVRNGLGLLSYTAL
jgi:hypothetical protein